MVYSTASDVQARFPGISTSVAGAKGFVERLVMQTIFDVLEGQGHSALLSDTVISMILGQLRVQISYEPMNCQRVVSPDLELAAEHEMKEHCIVVSNTVTGICEAMQSADKKMCMAGVREVTIKNVPSTALTISGTLSTTNIIMANWSRTMWQNVVNRAVRMLALGPFELHFFSAFATVGGN
ncbi:hypothetical protein KIN20_027099 [Parelaphostrongylus tenuis]|uniref:Uncharacterized protein n=1 Tax=Parelaphostrongylus tenuis TaxID=148309 RepID=A0AAD5QYZ2_PARTN|nr:hypothetical protein KIN20_027099 [Parelaphostrongylus tenuis]